MRRKRKEWSRHPQTRLTPHETPVFYVRDNGIGIREKHLDTVFGIFKRLHEKDKFGGGTDAGLTMTKKMVERHGGKIWVESTFGEGAIFYFMLATVKHEQETHRVAVAV